MRVTYIVLLLVACVIVHFVICQRSKLKIGGKIWLLCVLLCVFLFGSSLINVSVLPKSQQDKLNEVVETCGSTYIKSEGSKIYVRINDSWLNLSRIKVIGTFTDEYSIEYDGKVINLGKSGVVSTIEVLQDVGLIKSEESNGN